jgi:hypothetical protein
MRYKGLVCEFKERENALLEDWIAKLDNENQAAWACICTIGASLGFDTWLVAVRLWRDRVVHVAKGALRRRNVEPVFVGHRILGHAVGTSTPADETSILIVLGLQCMLHYTSHC